MRIIISQKMSGTGSIHDLADQHRERVIKGRGKYAVVLAAFYGGRGYTTHATEGAAIRQAKKLRKNGYSLQILDSDGKRVEVCNDRGTERLGWV